MSIIQELTIDEKRRIGDLVLLSGYADPSELDYERDLVNTKWFDYRFMSPLDATQRFADAYVGAFRAVWRQQFDRDAASSKRALAAGGLFHNRREFALMWGARQAADAIGVPYEVHIRNAMKIKLDLGWTRPPRPNQLCGELKASKMVPALLRYWNDQVTAVPFTGLPEYRLENFVGFQAQIDHQDYVLDRVTRHGLPQWAAGSASIAKRLVPLSRFAERYDEDFVARAEVDGLGETPEPIAKIDVASMLPSCFGRIDVDNPGCGICPAAKRCNVISRIARQVIKQKYGAGDPVKARAAGLNADRQRRWRQNRAAERAGAKATAATAPTPVVALSA